MAIINKYYPFVLSIIITIIAYSYSAKLDFQKLADSSLNLFSIVLGFLLTIVTIIKSLDNANIKLLKKHDSFKTLIKYLKTSINFCGITSVFSLLYAFLNGGLNKYDLGYINLVLLFFIIYSILLSFRFIYVFMYVILKDE